MSLFGNRKSNYTTKLCAAEPLEVRAMLSADPLVSWGADTQSAMIGEELSVSLSFDNASLSDAGFGPYIDVLIPESTGGVEFLSGSPSYLGAELEHQVLTIGQDGQIAHPYAVDQSGAAVQLSGDAGDRLLVMRLPFGGFVADQPVQTVDFSLQLSPDVSLDDRFTLKANGGFQYGSTPVNDPLSDPTIVGAVNELVIAPQVFDASLDYLGPESETATGPSFSRTYRVTVDVADGQTIDGALAKIEMPDTLVYTGARSSFVDNDDVEIVVQEDGQQLVTIDLGSVVGGPGAVDAEVLLDFYVPQTDSDSLPVLDPSTGDDRLSTTTLDVDASWSYEVTPTEDEEDPAPIVYELESTDQHRLSDQSIAVQEHASKLGSGSLRPGDTVQHRLDFQVSDFFAFDDVVLSDTLADGLRIDPDYAPVLVIESLGVAGVIAAGNYTLTEHWSESDSPTGPIDGSHRIELRVSDELRLRGHSGLLIGADSSELGPVTGSVTFRSIVQDAFSEDYPSGEAAIDEGDRLRSSALITGALVDPLSGQSLGTQESDDSGSALRLPFDDLSTSVYAINGDTNYSAPRVAPGDEVTFRLRREVLHGDAEDLVLSAYLPIPLVEAIELSGLFLESNQQPPESGAVRLGPSDTLHSQLGVTPTFSVDATANRLTLDYGDLSDSLNRNAMIDVLVTLTATDEPFADGLLLTSHAHSQQQTTNAGGHRDNALTQVIVAQPELHLSKGIVSSDNPAARFTAAGRDVSAPLTSQQLAISPIDADVSWLDAGDQVRVAIVVENRGSSHRGAYDVRIRDEFPAGLQVPEAGLNLTVTNGSGEELPYLELSGGLFGQGIELIDTESGALANHSPDSGENLVVISYDAVLDGSVAPEQVIASTATVTNYAGLDGGKDHTAQDLTDSAAITTAPVDLEVVLKQTSLPETSGTNVAIGELVTYEAIIALPEGRVSDLELVGTLSRGLTIVSVDSLEASPALLSNTQIEAAIESFAIESIGSGEQNSARRWRVNLGDLDNSDRDNASSETITITFTATATNYHKNDQGDRRSARVDASWQGGSLRDNAPRVRIVEPRVEVNKTIGNQTGDAGDTVTVSLTVDHHHKSGANAHDLVLVDQLAYGVSYVEGSLRWTGEGAEPSALFIDNQGRLIATWGTLAKSQSSQLQYEVLIDDLVSAGQDLSSPAELTWTGLVGDPGQVSPYNVQAVERTSDATRPGGSANDYRGIDSGVFFIAAPSISKSVLATSAEHTQGSEVTIGETVRYQLEVTVPEGHHMLRLEDLFPPQTLAFQAAEIVHVGDNLSGVSIDQLVSEGALVIELGQVTNPPDGVVTDDDKIRLWVDLEVLDHPDAEQGVSLVNTARVDYLLGAVQDTAVVEVVEPQLVVDKRVDNQRADALDRLHYTITIRHGSASGADAFDLSIEDVVDTTHLEIDYGSLQVTQGTATASANQGAITAHIETLAVGEEIVIEFDATITAEAEPSETILNTANASWHSLPASGREYGAAGSASTRINSSSLAGAMFVDVNGDGVQQAEDLGIGHSAIILSGVDHQGEQVERILETDCDGNFVVEGLRPGVYSLTSTTTDNRPDGPEFAGVLGGEVLVDTIGQIVIPAASDGEYGDYRFTKRPWSGVSGFVFDDADNDGLRHCEEQGIAGVELRLSGVNDLGEVVNLSTVTELGGAYDFGELRAGDYTLTQSQPEGWLDGATENESSFNIETGGAVIRDFAELRPSSLSGYTYVDLDRDGVHDKNDLALVGRNIVLTGINDRNEQISLTTKTSLDGKYRFVDLRPGRYMISTAQPSDFTDGRETIGSFDGYPDPIERNGVIGDDSFSQIDLTPGERGYNYNFGELNDQHLPGILATDFENSIVFAGTSGNDQFLFEAGLDTHRVVLNGVEYLIDASTNTSVRYYASRGQDTVVMHGSEYEDRAELRFGSAKLVGTGYELRAYTVEHVTAHGGGGEDRAYLYDSSGNDTLVADPDAATLAAQSGKVSKAIGFHRTYTQFTGGHDTAELTGSESRDTFKAMPEKARLYGESFYNSVTGYDTVKGIAVGSGDRVHLWGSDGVDSLIASAASASLTGAGYQIESAGFTRLDAYSNDGQNDSARLNGAAGDDSLTASAVETQFDTADTRIVLHQYHSLIVDAGAGGDDKAHLYDSACDDILVMTPTATRFSGEHFDNIVTGFERVYAQSSEGGNDTASFADSTGDDVFKADPHRARMYGAGYYNVASGFHRVTASATQGHDRAYLTGGAGDDVLLVAANASLMMGGGYSNLAIGFDRTYSYSHAAGHDRVFVLNQGASIRSDDVLRIDSNQQHATAFDFSCYEPHDQNEPAQEAFAEMLLEQHDSHQLDLAAADEAFANAL